MKKIVINLFAITCLLISCTSSKELINQKPGSSQSLETVGHLKMGLIGYEIIDTVNMTVEKAEMMMSMVKPSLETELVFNSTRSAELLKENDKYVRTSLYDRSTKILYKFVKQDSIEFYSEENLSEKIENLDTSDEDLEQIAKMFKVIPYVTSKTEILGFKCDEVTVMKPPEFTEINVKTYTTDKIPHVSEAMGPMGQYFSGAPIKTMMWRSGLKIILGAVEFKEDKSMECFLKIDESKLQKISKEEFELKK